MAKLILTEAGEDVAVGGNITLIGTVSPGEVIEILWGNVVLDPSFNTGGDTVILPGNAGSYSVSVAGSMVTIVGTGVSVSIPAGIVGLDVQFGDATRSLRFDVTANAVLLGEQTVTGTAQGVTPAWPSGDPMVFDFDVTLTAASDLISGVATVIFETRRDEDALDGHTYILTLDNDNAPPAGILTIDASGLAADTDGAGPLTAETVWLDASAVAAFSLNVTTGAASDRIFLGQGTDTISTGGGYDEIHAGSNLTAADTIIGGANTWLFLSGDYSDEAFAGSSSIEGIILETPGSSLIIGNNISDTGAVVFVDLSSGSTLIDASAYSGAAPELALVPSVGPDTLVLSPTRDSIQYSNVADSNSATGMDTIYGFTSGFDSIQLRSVETTFDASQIEFRGNVDGHLAAELALDTGDGTLDVVFDRASGVLWVDLDGNGLLNEQDLAIQLVGVTEIQGVDVNDGSFHFG